MKAYQSFLIDVARSLLTRLEQLEPFGIHMPRVPAATVSTRAEGEIHRLLLKGKKQLTEKVRAFIDLLIRSSDIPAADAQKALVYLKLNFNSLLDQLDIFADVLTQRGEHKTGVFLAGLDVLARDALKLKGHYFHPPPLACYLDRGHGAAIRRARTRLPGGKANPVALIRVPRERMISSSVSGSLIHEAGHQAAALLNLLPGLAAKLHFISRQGGPYDKAWSLLERWIGEIVSDFWSVAHLGIGSTLGLINVVSLPSYFVFRISKDGPHPFPWIRVKISCQLGKTLYPDPQWDKLERLWERLYPLDRISARKADLIKKLEDIMPAFSHMLITHRPASLRGKALMSVFPIEERRPARLRVLWREWQGDLSVMKSARPTLVFAVIGQAKFDKKINPQTESKLLNVLLANWALYRTHDKEASMLHSNKLLNEKTLWKYDNGILIQ